MNLPRQFLRLAGALLLVASMGRASHAALPEYRPEQKVNGVLRVCGSSDMVRLMAGWERGFREFQPEVHFVATLKGSATGIFGLSENVADFALMGRRMYTYETYGIYRRSLLLPVEVTVANGSVDVPRKSFALAVFVHRDNPLAHLTLKQLDAIFGAERTGGWQGLGWNKDVARTAETNIRTWGQLGLTGEWKDRPIHPYGPPALFPGGVSFFQDRVSGGADTRNEDLREFADPKAMIEALSRDPDGVAYTGLCYRTPGVKPLALAEKEGAPFVELSRAAVADGSYPLARQLYVYFPPDTPTGEPKKIDPKLREFLRYVLSRQGQDAVAHEGDYIPLNDEVVRGERKKLE